MPTARESLCCKEIPQIEEKLQELDIGDVTCITEHEGFHPVCLDQWVLQTAAYQTRQQYGNETTGGPPHKFVTIYEITASIGDADIRYNFLCRTLRYIAYRQLARWCWGYLGREIRVVLPSCAVCKIRNTFPSEDSEYVGFKL